MKRSSNKFRVNPSSGSGVDECGKTDEGKVLFATYANAPKRMKVTTSGTPPSSAGFKERG
jgi:hypothetical protein